MSIFSRRDTQMALDGLAGSLSKKQLQDLVGKLNGGEPRANLATQWEVVILSAFRQVGRVRYEADHGGKRMPDLFFQMGQSGKLEFAADITTISDVNAHDANPYDQLCEAIRRFLKKRGHTSAGLNIDVKHDEIGEFGDRKVRLMLPKKSEMDQFDKAELAVFLSGIAEQPDKDAAYSHDKNRIRFSVRYDSKEKRFSGGGHIGYTVPYSGQRNPLNNALKKKADQLSKSGYAGPRGIVICDGGCDALSERNAVSGAHGCREIMEPFLRSHKSVLFVLVLRIEERHGVFQSDRSIGIAPKVYWNQSGDKTLFQPIAIVLKRMLESLPTPESTPNNALRRLGCRNKAVGRPVGGFSMKGDAIKISARSLTELLAGKIERERFLEEHGFKPVEAGQRAFPFFEWQLDRGNTLKNAFVKREKHKDDDWIVLEYDGPDAAISPYRIPE
jgi:hypothetical protein